MSSILQIHMCIYSYLEAAEESLCVIISDFHGPVNWHRPYRWAKPADMLGRTPERSRALRRDRNANTKVLQVELVVLFAHNELVGTVSCEGADGCA